MLCYKTHRLQPVYKAATEAAERVVCSPYKAAPKMGQLLNVVDYSAL
jgi:hypothetical protein